MSESKTPPVTITRLPTGVPGLDEVLGGGLPEYSFTVIAGAPGSGKTTLAHQILFTLASSARPALYFSVMGEPMLKMLRYQQQMAYFDPAKVGDVIHYVNLSDALQTGDLAQVLAGIIRRVEEVSPGLVVLDSFQNIAHLATGGEELEVQGFVQRLALHLTSWQATTFLLGNYRDDELRGNPVFTVADGVLWLSQVTDHNSVVRKLQVVKMRGQELMPGLHTTRLDQAGLQVFPRITSGHGPEQEQGDRTRPHGRATTSVPGLDALLGGGIPVGDAVLVSGPSGTGKSVLTAQFIADGVRRGSSPSSRSTRGSTCGARSGWGWTWRTWRSRARSLSSTSGRWTSRRTRRWGRSARRWRGSGRGAWPSTRSRASSWRWRRTSGRISASRCTGWWGR